MRLTIVLLCSGLLCGWNAGILSAQNLTTPEGVLSMENKAIDDSEEARQAILDLYKGLRVTDVSDGMDWIGRPDVGVMRDYIRPLWTNSKTLAHVIVGFAVTTRYLPTDKVPPNPHPDGDYMPFQRMWYGTLTQAGWAKLLRPGDIVVIDANECDVGLMGSNNSMAWRRNGAVGVISNNGPRDTDEIIAMQFPVYSRKVNYGTNMGRVEIESWNRPINCGGVKVYPGDVVVADNDGVVVVPREHALEVGRIAKKIADGDQASRAKQADEMGLPRDKRIEKY
jgi:4-hydroxy-4-methyl-2-oxoglutarate aldolase